ncbi:hypothetical protein CVT25_014039 [Psilocybe cyanescens]|uniref:Uncharacterized protein n=1 Tax=Psilocybe cyanescens TaxID=93625 RepID=A0A409XJV4_PSICY|nr:hypothetical protein CVT25_014039 [Psilocybe cyanescens]
MGEGPYMLTHLTIYSTLWMVNLHDLLSPTTLQAQFKDSHIDLDARPFAFVGVSIEEGGGGPIRGVADVVCASSPHITFSGVPGALDATPLLPQTRHVLGQRHQKRHRNKKQQEQETPTPAWEEPHDILQLVL